MHPFSSGKEEKQKKGRSASENGPKNSEMLQTIRLPSNIKNLNKGMLPKNNYENLEKNEKEMNTIYSEQQHK